MRIQPSLRDRFFISWKHNVLFSIYRHAVWHTRGTSYIFNRLLCIDTTWDELSSECEASCLLNVGRVVASCL